MGVIDALEITETAFQVSVGIGLPAIDDIHIRHIRADGHHLYDTFALGVGQVVKTTECIVLRNQRFCCAAVHCCCKVAELHPVQPLAVLVGRAASADLRYYQFVLLGDISVTTTHDIVSWLILLYHDAVIHPELHVQLTVIGLHPHLASLRVVVVYLHHGREDTVVVLAE